MMMMLSVPSSCPNCACTDKSSAQRIRAAKYPNENVISHQSSVISHHLHIHKILPNIKFRILTICSFRLQVPLFNGSSYLRFAPLGDSALIWLELKVIFVNLLFTFISHIVCGECIFAMRMWI